MNPYEPPHRLSYGPTWWGRFWGRKLPAEPQRLLDDIAHAIHRVRVDLVQTKCDGWFWSRPRVKRKLTRSLLLADQFETYSLDDYWSNLWSNLECQPPTQPWNKGTIQDIVDHLCECGCLGDRLYPGTVDSQQWLNAQIFAGVQELIIDCLGVSKECVYRSARFVEDLQCC